MSNEETELLKKFGMKVKLERTKLNVSQEKLAEMAELSKPTIGAIERGESAASILTINALAKVFNLSLQEIVDLNF